MRDWGWGHFQAWAVDSIKRAALLRFHRSARGEAWLLKGYFAAEVAGETEGHGELRNIPAPDWLREHMRDHLADERRHVEMVQALLRPHADPPPVVSVDPLTRLKLRRMRRVAGVTGGRFEAGAAVPRVAMALVLEAMGVRVISRHLEVLRERDGGRPSRFQATLDRILEDERRHVAAFRDALTRLTAPGEQAELERLRNRLERIDRSWGILGAVGFFIASFVPAYLPRRALTAGAGT